MRVPFFVSLVLTTMILAASCGGSDHSGHMGHDRNQKPKTALDSLYSSIWDAHDLVMPKIGKIRGASEKASRMLDSINLALSKRSAPETTLEKSWKAALQSLVEDLNKADYAMDRWMTEFNIDSAQQKGESRRPYLESEKLKVDRVKESILRGLSKADSLFGVIK